MDNEKRFAAQQEGCFGVLAFLAGLLSIVPFVFIANALQDRFGTERPPLVLAAAMSLLVAFIATFRFPIWRHRLFMLLLGFVIAHSCVFLLAALD